MNHPNRFHGDPRIPTTRRYSDYIAASLKLSPEERVALLVRVPASTLATWADEHRGRVGSYAETFRKAILAARDAQIMAERDHLREGIA